MLNANRRYLLCMFEREEDLLAATRAVRRDGLVVVDAYAPYAVHGLDEAMGLRPSRLPWICFALGVAGAAFKVWFEYWTTAQDWPLNVGGKPWDSLPAFVPVTFEVMVLFAGLSTVAAFLVGRRLLPGRKAHCPFEGVTNDRFALVIEESDASFELARVRRLLERCGAIHLEESTEPQ